MRKRQKGFTLIELLVTIALMLSILGIAIVSFINISDRKKEESWGQVKEQIETAATEYFTAKEYLFEGLDAPFGTISVGKLVEEDYLSKVVNPKTGKALDECSQITVTKNGNKYTATYTGEIIARNSDGTCTNEYFVQTSEPGAPSGTITYKKEDGTITSSVNGWFNINSLGERKPLKICIIPNTNGNGVITKATIGNFEVTKIGSEYCSTIQNDGKYEDIIISLENISGKKWQVYNTIQKDTEKPNGTLKIKKKDTWFSKYVKLDFTGSDNVGLASVKIGNSNYLENDKVGKTSWSRNGVDYSFGNINYDGSTKTLEVKITDVAGNPNGDNDKIIDRYTVYNTCDDVTYRDGTTCTKTCGGGTYNKLAYDVHQTDHRCTAKDQNSGGSSCNTMACDTTPPTLTVRIYKRKSDGSNGTKVAEKSGSGTDMGDGKNRIELSGWQNNDDAPYGFNVYWSSNETIKKETWYWNKQSLNASDAANNDKYKWGTCGSGYCNGNYSINENLRNITHSFSAEGSRRGRIYVEDTSGNKTYFYIIIRMDRTAPTITINDGPKFSKCGTVKSVYTKYTVRDSVSGLDTVKDFYGDEASVPSANSSYWRDRNDKFTSGQTTNFTYEHNWGPNCSSYGNPGNYKYRLKYYLKDKAGNVRSDYTSATSSKY